MRRLFAAIFILSTLLGTMRFAAMDSMTMSHQGMADMACGEGACAATPDRTVPVRDCIDHCLSAAFDSVPAATRLAITLLTLTLIALAGSRSLAGPFLPRGAPPHLASLLRLQSLSTVIMRN